MQLDVPSPEAPQEYAAVKPLQPLQQGLVAHGPPPV